jgi:hypothetical protein
MNDFIGWFQPFWLLALKFFFLLIFLNAVGAGSIYLTCHRDTGKASRFPWPLYLPLGFGVTMTVGLILVRVLVITKAPYFAVVSMGAALAGGALIILAFRRYGARACGLQIPRCLVLLALTGFSFALTLTPLLIQPQMRYFAGAGTDSTGYIRIGKAMVDGWYFLPAPVSTLQDRIYRPARPWSLMMAKTEDRPGTYALVGVLSQWMRINVFQAQMLAGVLMVALFAAMLLFIADASGLPHPMRVLLGAAGLLLVPASGLIATFYNQFLAQMVCTVILVAVCPAIGIWMLLTEFDWRGIALGTFSASLMACYFYDSRFSLAVACSLVPAFAVTGLLLNEGLMRRGRNVALGLVGCALPPFLLHGRTFMLGSVPHFPDSTPLSEFIYLGGLGFNNWPTVLFYVLLWALLTGGLTNCDRILAHLRKQDPLCGGLFGFLFNCCLLASVAGMVFIMAYGDNPYGVKRGLWSLLPALIVLGIFYLSVILSDSRGRLRAAAGFCCVLIIIVVSALSLYRHVYFASLIANSRDAYGVITENTVSQLDAVRAVPQLPVMLTLDALPFLQLATILDDSGHPIYDPFSAWRTAATDLPEAQSRATHLQIGGMLAASGIESFFFSRAPATAPRWQIFTLTKAAGTLLAREVKFDVVFPPAGLGSEPLLTAGNFGDGFFVYAEYLPGDRVRLKFNRWGLADTVSAPMTRGNIPHHIGIRMDFADESIQVIVDGETAFHTRTPIRLDHLNNATLGSNHIGGGLTTPQFTGRISNVSGL